MIKHKWIQICIENNWNIKIEHGSARRQDDDQIHIRDIIQRQVQKKCQCPPVALEYDPAGHGVQTKNDVAPAANRHNENIVY